jgi:aspartate 1-decarboxylase
LLIRVCIAKIHHAIVTQTELNYVGSITIDQNLLDASGIRPFQYVNITNLSNGDFWQTYVIPGAAGNGDICLNGPPARHFQRGDKIIVMAEGWLEPRELDGLVPTIVFVDEKNRVARVERHPLVGKTDPQPK